METVLVATPREAFADYKSDAAQHAAGQGHIAINCHEIVMPEGVPEVNRVSMATQVWVYVDEGVDDLCRALVQEATVRGIPVYLKSLEN